MVPTQVYKPQNVKPELFFVFNSVFSPACCFKWQNCTYVNFTQAKSTSSEKSTIFGTMYAANFENWSVLFLSMKICPFRTQTGFLFKFVSFRFTEVKTSNLKILLYPPTSKRNAWQINSAELWVVCADRYWFAKILIWKANLYISTALMNA